MYVWDIGTRSGVIDFRGGQLEVHEFPFDGVNKVIYDENGVVIRSIPAVHGLDGAVSFILEWNGLKFVYGSDTIPNKWYVEHAKGADVAVHECFLPPTLLVTKQGFAPMEALMVGTQGHTSPEQFGKVMSLVKPRLAVGYHFYNDFDIEPEVRRRARKTYDGPLDLALDYMVWNVTKDDIRVRMSAVDEESGRARRSRRRTRRTPRGDCVLGFHDGPARWVCRRWWDRSSTKSTRSTGPTSSRCSSSRRAIG